MKYGFIGCGNMGGALARCVAKEAGKKGGGDEILLNNKTASKAEALAKEISADCTANCTDIRTLAKTSDYIFLGVKPQFMEDMLEEIEDVLAERRERFVLVSMAAGLSTDKILKMAGVPKCPIIRIMPNLAVSAGEGMTLYCSKNCSEEETAAFLEIMNCSGKLAQLPENLIDAGSAVSGCGPAFVFMFIEALADGGVACGLPRDRAQLLAAQTLLGSAKLLLESGKHPGQLKDNVCSPAGTTIEGVLALENGGFRSLAQDAVIAAYNRTLELK
ncbi:MAG: pyrroline-5-carboxylate reductase [Clostridia bacterium]|nr:pyrroline-5-carboxylate reductase [Clostridia bacterium]